MKRFVLPGCVVLVGVSLGSCTPGEQPASDDLQRPLDATAQQGTTTPDSAAGEQHASTGDATLTVMTDHACELSVNGSAQGALSAGVKKELTVAPGEQLMECHSAAGGVAKESKSVDAGEKAWVLLQPHFSDVGDGVLVDLKSGLQWTQSDNGASIDWPSATQWCSDKGDGWRLPDWEELSPLQGKPGVFLFTGDWYWTSNDNPDSSSRWHVHLSTGSRAKSDASNPHNERALCVRHP